MRLAVFVLPADAAGSVSFAIVLLAVYLLQVVRLAVYLLPADAAGSVPADS